MSTRPTKMARRPGSCRWIACWLCLLLQPTPAGNLSDNSTAEEYAIKAAFLFHFAQFVEWPEESFSRADSPLIYCTVGEDPFHGALDASLKDKAIGKHTLQVRHLRQVQDARECHLVFLRDDEKKQVSATLTALKGNPILTVGESERFVLNGGMIAFCVEEHKIRFDINQEAAEKANLKISARLLALARSVIRKPRRD